MRTRNFMPAAATGSSANGRDRMLGTTWAILYDRHARVMRWPWSAPAAWNFVAALLASPGLAVLVPTQRHALFRSCRTLPAICSTTRTFLCANTASGEFAPDFNQFPFLEVIDPFRP
jgi:hypothetical protein